MNIQQTLAKRENVTQEFKSTFNSEVIETLVAFGKCKERKSAPYPGMAIPYGSSTRNCNEHDCA